MVAGQRASQVRDLSPLAAGQGWAIKLDKPEFVGKSALAAQAAANDYDRIAGIVMDGRVPARGGYPVFAAGERVGEVRSGSIAPSAGGRSVATALVAAAHATEGARVAVEIRGTEHPATVVPLPFYKRG